MAEDRLVKNEPPDNVATSESPTKITTNQNLQSDAKVLDFSENYAKSVADPGFSVSGGRGDWAAPTFHAATF